MQRIRAARGNNSMDDFTTVNAGAKGAQEFICGTDTSYSEEQSTRIISIVATSIAAISDYRVEVIVGVRGAAPGATVEAFRADGIWASIGSMVGPQLSNPDVPSSYLMDAERISLRIAGFPGTQVTYYVHPIVTRLSSHKNNDGSISVTGSTTMRSGLVQAFSGNAWKGIGIVTEGVFSNPAVPSTYLYNANTMRVRVRYNDGVVASGALDSTLEFPHPRSVLIQPLQSAAAEQAAMSWRLRWADYQPTGYFAPAGTDVELWVSGNTENLTVLVGTQGMADRNNPLRQSESMRETPLFKGKNIIRDPLGGAIHIRKLIGNTPGVARIVFMHGAIPMPYYVSGATAQRQWLLMLLLTEAPEVELVGARIVVAALKETALKFSNVDAQAVMHSHEEVMRLEAEISGLDETVRNFV
ncbi:peptidase M60, partial [Pseudomonas syringae pv. actinidiae]